MYINMCRSEVVYWKELLGLWTALLYPFPARDSLSPEEGGFRVLPKNKNLFLHTTYNVSQ
jgi:hypothetical protein